MSDLAALIQKDDEHKWFYVENLPFIGDATSAQVYGQKFGLGVECRPSQDAEHTMAKFFGSHDQLMLLLTDFFGAEDAR